MAKITDKIKEIFSSDSKDEVKEIELTEEEYLSNPETIEELSNGKGEDDELSEPEAEEE